MDNRFEILKVEKPTDPDGVKMSIHILRDRDTGVLYMYNRIGAGIDLTGGITPILGKDGCPVSCDICPECGATVSNDATVCHECGYPLHGEKP